MDGLILAGGKSTRMGGKHKGFLQMEEETFMDRLTREMKPQADRLWISYGRDIHANYEECRVVVDEYPGCGPIAGIHAGLCACESELLMVAACDMPFLKSELYVLLEKHIADHDGAVTLCKGRIHPLAAIYRKRILTVLEEQLESGNYRLRDALAKMDIVYVDVSGKPEYEQMIRNINTIEEYRKIRIR